jgi:PD-(D/E)XK nuclease superfamily protein
VAGRLDLPDKFTAEDTEDAEVDEDEDERLNALTGKVIAAAIRVHRALGPGLLESAYEACTAFELVKMVAESSSRSRFL